MAALVLTRFSNLDSDLIFELLSFYITKFYCSLL